MREKERDMELILASGSPRRRELLSLYTTDFTVCVSDFDESTVTADTPAHLVEQLARGKCLAVAKDHPDAVVIGCDTVVDVNGEVFGKPHGVEDAKRMLRALSGSAHQVHTGVCVSRGGRTESFVDSCKVTFFPLSEEEIDQRVRQSAQFVGLTDEQLELSPFELSGGQKRRVAIAGVIAMEPEVLILDEPTAGLDPVGREEILSNIRTYHDAKNATIILVSHSMEEVAQTVDRVVVINDGTIPLTGTPQEVFSHEKELTAMGLGVPKVTQVCEKLRDMGLPIKDGIYTLEEAASELLKLVGKGGAVC